MALLHRTSLKCYLLLLLWLAFSAPAFSQSVPIIRLDASLANGGSIGDFFDEVNFIPLETTKESSFNDIDQLIITSKSFVILDRETNCILFFGKDGKYQFKIKGSAIGYSSSNPLYRCFVDQKNDCVFIPSPKIRGSFIRFDLNGKPKAPVNNILIESSDVQFLDDDYIVSQRYMCDRRMKDSLVHEVLVTKHGKIVHKKFPYNQRSGALPSRDILNSGSSNLYVEELKQSLLFVKPYDYSIYRISTTDIKKLFEFVFPLAQSLPASFATDTVFYGKRIEYIQKHPELIYNISHPYLFGSRFFFKLNTYSPQNLSMIYDIHTGDLVDIEKLTPDVTSSFFSISDHDFNGVTFANFNFGARDGHYLYTYTSALRLLNQKEANKEKMTALPVKLEKYFKVARQGDNPVLIQLKPKQN